VSEHLRARIAELEASLEASRSLVTKTENSLVAARCQRDAYKASYEELYKHNRELEVAYGDLQDVSAEKISNLNAIVELAEEAVSVYSVGNELGDTMRRLREQIVLNAQFGQQIEGAATAQKLLEEALRWEAKYEQKDHDYRELFNQLVLSTHELIDKDRDIDSLRKRLAFYEDACAKIVNLVQSHENKPIKAKKFILQLYQLAVSALSIHPPDGKTETTRIVKTEP
jgi:hypothetical protein